MSLWKSRTGDAEHCPGPYGAILDPGRRRDRGREARSFYGREIRMHLDCWSGPTVLHLDGENWFIPIGPDQ